VGLSRLTSQVRFATLWGGASIAAINGDFYQREGPYAGDPRGLQVQQGELLSAATGGSSFWVDPLGEPHATNVTSLMQVTWPDGSSAPIGLNGIRKSSEVELYTPAIGRSTLTAGGRELILERVEDGQWLPLRPGRTYRARIREIVSTGNSPITSNTLVLSIGPAAFKSVPTLTEGSEIALSTATVPSMKGVRTAIGGGPVLVHEGKRQKIGRINSDSFSSSSMVERHPRSAIGWSESMFFLVEVDGRQEHSVGNDTE
jgi:hypothetical protein